MRKTAITEKEYPAYFQRYIDKVPEDLDLIEGLRDGKKDMSAFISEVPEMKLEYRYAEDKWTIKEVIQHVIDTERIFRNRLFRISRKDPASLPSFDQNIYIVPSHANDKNRKDLLEEFVQTRAETISIVSSLSLSDMMTTGISSGLPLSARAAGFIILGHEKWHCDIIRNRYLN